MIYDKKYLNKNQDFLFKYAFKENCTKNAQPFSIFFFFYKQIKNQANKKNRGWKVFQKNLPPKFCICLYIIGAGGDEDLKRNIWQDLSIHPVNQNV